MNVKTCWDKYAAHLKNWYVGTYSLSQGTTKAINDGRLIEKTFLIHKDGTTYQNLKARGVKDFAARSVILYVQNTKESYMSRCRTDTGGFAVDVACMSDNDCPRGYRCRGSGKDSECIEEGEAAKPSKLLMPSLPSLNMPDIGLPGKGIITILAIIFIGLLALIALGYSGLGGAAGSHLEK